MVDKVISAGNDIGVRVDTMRTDVLRYVRSGDDLRSEEHTSELQSR